MREKGIVAMIIRFAVAALLAAMMGGCVAPPLDNGASGAAPANFSYRSDAENARALLSAAESGKAAAWSVSPSRRGAATPTAAAYPDQVRRPCQPLRLERDGAARQVTACKGADGTWVVAEWAPERGQ